MADVKDQSHVKQLLKAGSTLPDPLALMLAIRKDTAECTKAILQKWDPEEGKEDPEE